MGTDGDSRRVNFQSPEYFVDRLGAIAELFGTDRRDLLVEAIRSLADELARAPTATEMEEYGAYSPTVAQHRFGTWNTALEEAGFDPHTRKDIPEEGLLDELTRFHAELGHVLSSVEMDGYGQFTIKPYLRRYGYGKKPSKQRASSTTDIKVDLPIHFGRAAMRISHTVQTGTSNANAHWNGTALSARCQGVRLTARPIASAGTVT